MRHIQNFIYNHHPDPRTKLDQRASIVLFTNYVTRSIYLETEILNLRYAMPKYRKSRNFRRNGFISRDMPKNRTFRKVRRSGFSETHS